jgi:hypothetical protein
MVGIDFQDIYLRCFAVFENFVDVGLLKELDRAEYLITLLENKGR